MMDLNKRQVEIEVGRSPHGGTTIWINIDGVCALRVHDAVGITVNGDEVTPLSRAQLSMLPRTLSPEAAEKVQAVLDNGEARPNLPEINFSEYNDTLLTE